MFSFSSVSRSSTFKLSFTPAYKNKTAARVDSRKRSNQKEKKSPISFFTNAFIGDAGIFIATGALIAFSIIMVYSTTGVLAAEKFSDSLFYVKRQIFAVFIGLVGLVCLSNVKISFFKKYSHLFLFACFLLLALPYLPGLGHAAGGARRWINIGPVHLQPGEFVKLGFVIFIAGFFARHESRLNTFSQGVFKPVLLLIPVCAILLLQPDFGSAAILAGVTLCMASASGSRLRYILISGFCLSVAAAILIISSPYRMNRIISFLTPWADASGKGYQLIQSLIAIGSGQFSGVGLGASQQKLLFLPAAHTDFIFAVIAEELGFVGCLVLICVFLLFFWRGIKLATKYAEDTFSFALCVGLTLLIVLPALLNMGVTTGMLPTKGLVLPLIGYGGSSIIASLFAVGILLSLAREFKKSVS
ncbi:MAG: putative lipid II flippase FtsW [Bdellovibrionales bacterium]|nr:putative lipid II flippase FtsW [Bdellovibrionales bacterium]